MRHRRLELLRLAKDFAKANMDHPDGILPKEVAAVLYYASISAALLRLDERISQLKDADLERGLRWAKDQPWVNKQIQQLLADAIEKLNGGSGSGERLERMKNDPANQEPTVFEPPVSAVAGPIAELVGHRLAFPARRAPVCSPVLSHYEVVRVLGSGGMGVVLLARDSETGKQCRHQDGPA